MNPFDPTIGDFSTESHSRVTFKVDTDGEILTVQKILIIIEENFHLITFYFQMILTKFQRRTRKKMK